MNKVTFDLDGFIAALRTVLPIRKEPYPLHEPWFCGNEWSYVKECLDTGWVSSVGSFVDRFESDLAELTGVTRAVVTVNGTAALQICLQLSGVKPGDEVLVPALTFVATANAVVYCGAVPHFVDCSESTLGICPQKLSDYLNEIAVIRGNECYNRISGRRIKALIAMHVFGHPCDIENLQHGCQGNCIEFIEDAAESLGSYYKGRHTGSFGRLSALSFNGNKIVTTGGGGAILTNDSELGKLAKHITTTSKLPHKWAFYHDQLGYNFRMPNLNAALGCAQLEKLHDFVEAKRKLAGKFKDAFESFSGVKFFSEPEFATSNYWLNALILAPEHQSLRDELLEKTHHAGILTRPAWILMPHLPMYQNCPRMDLSVAESLQHRIINIPSSPALSGN